MENNRKSGAPVVLASPAQLLNGVARLSRGAYFKEAPLDMALSILTESAARISGVGRVSIWGLAGDRQELNCLELFELSAGCHSSGECVRACRCPAYFQALGSESSIVAEDALVHPMTAGFASDYLLRHRITALLDTPIHIRGELQGVLSLEQVVTREPWSPAHHLFAHAIANLVALALVEYEAVHAKEQAKKATDYLRRISAPAPDAALLSA